MRLGVKVILHGHNYSTVKQLQKDIPYNKFLNLIPKLKNSIFKNSPFR